MIPKEIKYNLHYDDVREDFLRPPYGKTPDTIEYNKSRKGFPLETKNTQNHEIRRLGLIESLHTQHCSLWGCILHPYPHPPPPPRPSPPPLPPPSAGWSGIRFLK